MSLETTKQSVTKLVESLEQDNGKYLLPVDVLTSVLEIAWHDGNSAGMRHVWTEVKNDLEALEKTCKSLQNL